MRKDLFTVLTSSYFTFGLFVFTGAYCLLNVERGASDANILNYADALWFSLNASSVGNSNFYPVTNLGRLIGAVLILVGYALFTLNIAVISSYFSHKLKQHKER
jgi:voltage-gated potassium channel